MLSKYSYNVPRTSSDGVAHDKTFLQLSELLEIVFQAIRCSLPAQSSDKQLPENCVNLNNTVFLEMSPKY